VAGSRERYIYSKQNVEFRGSESSSGGESPRIRQQQKRSRLLLFFIYYILSGTHDGERHPKTPPPLARMQEDTPLWDSLCHTKATWDTAVSYLIWLLNFYFCTNRLDLSFDLLSFILAYTLLNYFRGGLNESLGLS